MTDAGSNLLGDGERLAHPRVRGPARVQAVRRLAGVPDEVGREEFRVLLEQRVALGVGPRGEQLLGQSFPVSGLIR